MLIKFYRRVKTFITTLHVKSFLNVRPRKIKIAEFNVENIDLLIENKLVENKLIKPLYLS